jgi:hypothetical protein
MIFGNFSEWFEKAKKYHQWIGRKNKITFDTYDLDKDIKSLNRKSTIYLSAFDNTSKANGIFKTSIQSNADPVKIKWKMFGDTEAFKKQKMQKNIF